MDSKFHLEVKSRDGMVFNGEATSISSYNKKGKFDVLAQHANFISLINKKLIIDEGLNSQREIEIDNGLLRVRERNMEVYLGVEGLSPITEK